jgi:hypothetical protein
MKKLMIVAAFATIAAASQAAAIFDNMTGLTGVTTSSSVPGFLFGDGATAIASSGGAGSFWKFTSVDYAFFVLGAQTMASGELGVKIDLFGSYTDLRTGATPVFGTQFGSITANYGAITTTGNAAFTSTLTLGTPINAPVGMTTLGYTVSFTRNNVRTDTVRAGIGNPLNSTVGLSPHGFYRDANDNGIIEGSDWRQFSATEAQNLLIRFNGDAVPEPATMAVLGLGAAALLRRRRKA